MKTVYVVAPHEHPYRMEDARAVFLVQKEAFAFIATELGDPDHDRWAAFPEWLGDLRAGTYSGAW